MVNHSMKTTIPKLRLGTSNLEVSVIGLGCWQFSKHTGMIGKFWPPVSDEETRNIIKVSLENGINWFDTAEAYGWGASEKSLSGALDKLGVKKKEVIIATKWWPILRFAGSIEKTIGKRLQALTGYNIDLYQIHQPYALSSVTQQMHCMADLVEENKIRYVGVSNFSAKQMRLAFQILKRRSIPLISNQVNYSLLNRKIESNGILKTANELGISIIAYSPLAQGILSGKFHKDTQISGKNIGIRQWIPAFRSSGLKKSKPGKMLVITMAASFSAPPFMHPSLKIILQRTNFLLSKDLMFFSSMMISVLENIPGALAAVFAKNVRKIFCKSISTVPVTGMC